VAFVAAVMKLLVKLYIEVVTENYGIIRKCGISFQMEQINHQHYSISYYFDSCHDFFNCSLD